MQGGAFVCIPPGTEWREVAPLYPDTTRYVLLHAVYEPFILTVNPDGSKSIEPIYYEGDEH
jgi:hypothetical protein